MAAAGCAGGIEPADAITADDGVRVASFDFAESELLAELYAQAIEATGTPVVRLGVIGPREIVAPALAQGRVDLVPEYVGSALRYAGVEEPSPDTETALAQLAAELAPRGLAVLDAAPAEDKNVLVVRIADADRADLRTISDLAPVASELTIGGPPECVERPLCLAGLESVYGLEFSSFVAQRSLRFTVEALQRGEIDVGVMFSTAAPLVAGGLFVLDDDRRMQPAENVVPVIRRDALDRWGTGVEAALNAVSAQLTTLELRVMNVQVDDGSVGRVVETWLAEHGASG